MVLLRRVKKMQRAKCPWSITHCYSNNSIYSKFVSAFNIVLCLDQQAHAFVQLNVTNKCKQQFYKEKLLVLESHKITQIAACFTGNKVNKIDNFLKIEQMCKVGLTAERRTANFFTQTH